MKPIFSSLGSNYSFSDGVRAVYGLFASYLTPATLEKDLQQLQERMNTLYSGTTFFFYKGRDAIECALRAFSITEGDVVITQAFTCYAIEEAIMRTGAQPVYIDIAEKGFNLELAGIQKAVKKHGSRAKAVIVQYSLGTSLQTEKIKDYCSKHGIVLIEDLAQGYGATTTEGRAAGSIGDAVIFSFGRDKCIDAVSGGACCLREVTDTQLQQTAAWYSSLDVYPSFGTKLSDALYPFEMWFIRTTLFWGVGPLTVGKLLLFLGKKTKLFTSPLKSPTTHSTLLPLHLVPLLSEQLASFAEQLKHRKKIQAVYDTAFASTAATLHLPGYPSSSGLKYPLIVADPDDLAKKLKKYGIFIADRWYRAAVDCSTLACDSVYSTGTAPNAEKRATQVISLPTHKNIGTQDAERLVEAIQKAHS